MSNMLLIPGDGAPNPFTVFGAFPPRSYSCAANSTVVVNSADGAEMISAGWVDSMGNHGHDAGPTSSRPAAQVKGHIYNDTTINAIVVWCGSVTGWRNSVTGASA